jgi:Tol biopolymer transport system component
MPTYSKPKLLLPALVLLAALAFPVAASATLSYVKNPFQTTVFVADDDGSDARKVDTGSSPYVAPNGESIVYLHQGPKNAQELKLAPASGGPGKTLMTNFREAFYLAWSPDSKTIAALRGPELGKRNLVLIDVAGGKQQVIASGYFSGFSFSPDSTEIVYSRAGSEKYPPRSDVFRFPVPIPGVINVRAPEPVRLTSDHRSSDPLWGPDQIVFVKTVEGKKRRYGPKNELYLMNPQGKGVKRLTHTKVPPLLQGLFPTDWSADGNRLLAEFEGQDTSYAVVVDPQTGRQRLAAGTGETGFVGTALSVDGSRILGFTGGFDPGGKHEVLAVPYKSGRSTVLASNAFEPSWSRDPKTCLAYCAP